MAPVLLVACLAEDMDMDMDKARERESSDANRLGRVKRVRVGVRQQILRLVGDTVLAAA